MKHKKRALFQSVISLMLCLSVLVGTTFAWFTDSASSEGNIIKSGNLKISMKWTADLENQNWQDASKVAIFDYSNWEPGYTDLKYLQISNDGNLAFQYQLTIEEGPAPKNGISADGGEPAETQEMILDGGEVLDIDESADGENNNITDGGNVTSGTSVSDAMKLAEVIDVYYLDATDKTFTRQEAIDEMHRIGTLAEVIRTQKAAAQGVLLPEPSLFSKDAETPASMKMHRGSTTAAIMLKMREDAGNAYMGLNPEHGYCVKVFATQYTYEKDSFGSDYDAAVTLPEFSGSIGGTASVETDDNGLTTAEVSIGDETGGATIPAGVQTEAGTTELTLAVTKKDASEANIVSGENENLLPLDVHITGVAANNTTPIRVNLGKILPEGMNIGNVTLYHVETSGTNPMTQVFTLEELDAHNEFYYDPVTGNVTVSMATFSEVAVVSDKDNVWEGNFDYSWYTNAVTPAASEAEADYTIANADQLAAFGAIVGGMNGQTQDSFAGETVKLLADINLNDASEDGKIFYPIGYYNSTGSYEKTSGGSVTSSVSSFEGTFDGGGHTIANFYQNTWEMFGDYNDGYSGTPNHYKDAMGLFGYVLNGTVKNLTVGNFSSDGEFTPTGVIAAYADGNSTFENIAITNCNPRVYNTGNGGIIGIAGDTAAANDDHITMKNITVDNSNKITALWGSWDVACGGLVGMYRGNVDGSDNATGDTISFENCHVSAQIDVYNDVCANYQYYAYRYAGMIIGSVRHNTQNTEGKTIPNMTGISATGCTVNYGDWNDYYYCEFEKNSMASYSEDYQFSRVPHSELNFTDSNGNGVVDADERDSVTGCKHTHTAEENHQAIYLPFHQLFTGYSWGVSSIGLEKYNGIVTDLGITEGEQEGSVEKFEQAKKITELPNAKAIKISDIFKAKEGVTINSKAVVVSATALDENADGTPTVTCEYVPAGEEKEWTEGTIKFTGTGKVKLTIQDYNFCIPTTIEEITIIERPAAEKFEVAFDHDPNTDGMQNYVNLSDYFYRVGNQNTVALSSLFSAKENTEIGKVSVTFESDKGNASGTFTANTSDWAKGTIKFTGTGVVKITIQDDNFCTPTVLKLEVVDAVNATTATSAKSNNVVLLNDVGFSTIEVSGGYTLYGNGFKMTASNDVMYDTMNAGFVVLKNGTLDNVQVICPNFSYAIIYNSQIQDSANTAVPSDSSNDARGNVRSGVMADGNSKILDSYIHGGRAAIYLRSGNLLVDNSTISGGAAANIHALFAQSLTLRDATLVQKPFQATVHDTSKTVMGFSGLFECGEDGNSTPLILEGTLKQDAWINEEYTKYVPSSASSIVDKALEKTEYLHDLDGDGKNESLNLGFTYIPQETNGSTIANVTDNRTNKSDIPYEAVDVGTVFASAKVYSYKNTKGTSEDFMDVGEYVPSVQGNTVPTLTFTDTNGDRVFETKFDSNDNRWESTLTVNLDKGNYTFNFDNLQVQKHGEDLTYTVKTADGTVVDTSKAITLTASGVTEYIITVPGENATAQTSNARSSVGTQEKPFEFYFIVTATKTSIPDPVVADTTGGTPLLVVKSKNSDWTVGIPALEGIKVKYYTVDGEVILDLVTLTPTSTGKQNGTNNYWETTKDSCKLKVTCGYIHEGKQVYGMPVVVDNNGTKQMYFTISSTSGYVSTGTAARSVTLTYEFTDPNGKTVKFTKNYNVKYADYKDVAQYSYSDFVNGTMTDLLKSSSGGGTCVTPDTLITLANGKQVRVDALTGNEQLLVWNMETGKLDSAPIMFVDSDPKGEYEVIHLYFSDGTDVKVISEHGFWDYDLNRYIYLDRYAEKYIGHTFAKQSGSKLAKVKLTDVVLETETTTAWSPVTAGHLCYFVNGMLSMPGGVGGLFNIFDVDPATMTYDYEAMARDIETYGLFTYEEMNAIVPLSEDMFNAAGGAYLKISMGKDNLTVDELVAMINRYSKFI